MHPEWRAGSFGGNAGECVDAMCHVAVVAGAAGGVKLYRNGVEMPTTKKGGGIATPPVPGAVYGKAYLGFGTAKNGAKIPSSQPTLAY